MKVPVRQLASQLQGQLSPVYLVTGEEPLQVQESLDAIRQAARDQGYTEREILTVDKNFNWNSLMDATASLSLFAERRIIDLRMTPKPGKEGGAVLIEYVSNPPPDVLLLISCDKIDASGKKTKWFKSLDAAGVVVECWPLKRGELSGWIRQRMQERELQASNDAIELLADRVEGNLLAASQEIEKLLLLYGPCRLDVESVANAVADSSRFNIFQLVDNALGGQLERTIRMLSGLRGEGISPVLVSWALMREIRSLTGMAQAVATGQGIESVLASYRVWENRKPILRMALKRTPLAAWYQLLRQSGHVERVTKGAAVGNAWDELLQLGAGLAGVAPLGHQSHAS